jgi:phosphoribosyl-dephospho-CoA transferase
MEKFRAHDLLWLKPATRLLSDAPLPEWVLAHWHPDLPLVVRRDRCDSATVAVGVRGMQRIERAAAWVNRSDIARVLSPEDLLAETAVLQVSPFVSYAPIQALLSLMTWSLPFRWGVTGSCGYALATGLPVMRTESDLDLLLRCDSPPPMSELVAFSQRLNDLPCRVDVQVNTPYGGFALAEGIKGGKVMLKTERGPCWVADPWDGKQVSCAGVWL